MGRAGTGSAVIVIVEDPLWSAVSFPFEEVFEALAFRLLVFRRTRSFVLGAEATRLIARMAD